MRSAWKLLLICSLPFLVPIASFAQDEARAAWQVTKFDITVNNPGAERALNARATISVRNIGLGSGTTLTLRLSAKAEIKSVTIGGTSATYKSLPESHGGAQRITITLPNPVAANENVSAAIEYRLPVDDNTGLAAISPTGTQFLPASLWYPTPNTQFAVRGADYAPFHLTINGATAISSGAEVSANGNSAFEQSLNAQPFFVAASWDRVEGGASAKGISAYLPKGAGADERKQSESFIAVANEARSFFSGLLGTAVDVPLRLVAVPRGGGFDSAGTILIGEGAFRRRKTDSATALSISEGVARCWIGADSPIRSEGNGVLREGLARFLATLFIEKQFGPEAAEVERARQRLAYSSIAKRDGPLSRTTPLDSTYFNSVGNKGAMVWRLIDHNVGRDAFVATLRTSLLSAKTSREGLSLAGLRSAFTERGGANLKSLLDQEFDQPTDMDLMVGLPHLEGNQWVAALRNLGSIEATTKIVAKTDAGQQINGQATVPAHDFAQVTFTNASKIVRVEIDPEKFYPQIDYSNDMAPRQPEAASSLAEATRLFGAQEYARAENLARELLASSPHMQEARIVLARALLAENKTDEAEREFKQLAAEALPTPTALAWSSIGLGEIALRRGQSTDATRNFTDAVRADGEYASTLAARAARIRAESSVGVPPIDEAAKSFVSQFDAAIRSGRQAEISALVVPGELVKFVHGAVGTQPENWQTRVLRSEQVDADRLALDVAINSKQLGVEHSGTAVFILARVNGTWKLNAIDFFEVK